MAAGAPDSLASDYHPPSLLAAAYQLEVEGASDPASAVDLVSGGPARLCGFTDRGGLRPGARADPVAGARRGASRSPRAS